MRNPCAEMAATLFIQGRHTCCTKTAEIMVAIKDTGSHQNRKEHTEPQTARSKQQDECERKRKELNLKELRKEINTVMERMTQRTRRLPKAESDGRAPGRGCCGNWGEDN